MNQNFIPIPKVNFIHTRDELRPEIDDLTTQEFINKKRKLSEDYSQGSTNTRKESMNDSFTCIKNNSAIPLKNTSSDFSVNIPKPIRPCYSNKKINNPGLNNAFNESQKLVDKLLKMKLNDMKPITDYLQKQQEVEKHASGKDRETKDEAKPDDPKKIANDKYSSFPLFYFPFGVPLGKTTFSEFLHSFEEMKKTSSQTPSIQFVGPLTLEERNQKVKRYLEKKKKRKWKYVRYNIRKDLADQRQRVQGRFVKTNKIKFPFMITETKGPLGMSDSFNADNKSEGCFMEQSNNSL